VQAVDEESTFPKSTCYCVMLNVRLILLSIPYALGGVERSPLQAETVDEPSNMGKCQ